MIDEMKSKFAMGLEEVKEVRNSNAAVSKT
jgi:hypothetical protein